jgi:hypothetical protein
MMPLSTSHLITTATALVGIQESGHNRGQMVELMLMEVGQLPGAPWCAAFVHHAGYWSHFDHALGKSSWPLPRTASCWELGEFARVRGVRRSTPESGDVFLVHDASLGRFAHTGIIVRVDACLGNGTDVEHLCTTIEGNSNEDGAREGVAAVRRTRRFSRDRGDRFIRWVELAKKARAA